MNTTRLNHRSLYAAFDLYPSAKGAATHIQQTSSTLFQAVGGGLLCVLGDSQLPAHQLEKNIETLRFTSSEPNYLRRARAYTSWLQRLVSEQKESLELVQFRDPWSGLALLNSEHSFKTIFEINGLPSIELPYLYPGISEFTLKKIRTIEEYCWRAADLLVTPSSVLKSFLTANGVHAEKIQVIPNGSNLPSKLDQKIIIQTQESNNTSHPYILYFGALQPWQGVETLLQAFSLLKDLNNLFLVICVSGKARQTKPYRKLARRLDIESRIIWKYRLQKPALERWVRQALLTVAPLSSCTRNLEQGCCPIKILESMACSVPVIASDIPAIREIINNRGNGYLIQPDRPAELSRAIRLLHDYPDYLQTLGANARKTIEQSFTWETANFKLQEAHRSLLNNQPAKCSPFPQSQEKRTNNQMWSPDHA